METFLMGPITIWDFVVAGVFVTGLVAWATRRHRKTKRVVARWKTPIEGTD